MRKSFQAGFKVAETVGKAAEGEDSLLSLNLKIMNATKTSEIFEPMRRLCVVCASQRKLISKVRGDSDDFLNYAVLGYVQRWQKQFEKNEDGTPKIDKRRPVQDIQNWIPYILGTIRFALISFNKEAFDYDFLPLPRLLVDTEDDEGTPRDLADINPVDPLLSASFRSIANRDSLRYLLSQLPLELQPYKIDILYYISTGQFMSKNYSNYAKIGRAIFIQKVEEWVI